MSDIGANNPDDQGTIISTGAPDVERVSVEDLPAHLRSEDVVPDALADVEIEDPWMETEEQARQRKWRQAQAKAQRWYERLPADYEVASLEDFDPAVAGRAAQALSDPQVRTVVIAGAPGTGKTHLGYAMGRLALAEGAWVEAWTVHDMMSALQPSGINPRLMEKRAKRCRVLLLDDLGSGRVSDFAKDTLTSIIDARVSNRLKTIITTNSTEPILRSVWDDRLMDRIRHGLVAIRLEGPSRRAPAW